MKKKWSIKPCDKSKVIALKKELNISHILCQVLNQRGVENFDEAHKYFRPKLSELHSPFLMKDMDSASKRVISAIKNNEKVLLYGDYDVDGTTAVSLLSTFLEKRKALYDIYIPDRHLEGYGVSEDGVRYAIKNDIALIITLDCGIKDFISLDLASNSKIDVIVCDHHLTSEMLPNAYAILNPKRKECSYPNPNLSGCGVGFKLIQAVSQYLGLEEGESYQYLDFVAISIACDMVPVIGENRCLAYHGLRLLEKTNRPGIKVILEQSGLLEKIKKNGHVLNFQDLGFIVGPKINAAGRLGHAFDAVRLLLAKSSVDASICYENLLSLNAQRRLYQEKVIDDIRLDLINNPDKKNNNVLVFHNESWHKGVVGIAASKMVEQYFKPCIIFSGDGEILSGSARTIPGLNIYEAIYSCKQYLIRFGGHKAAAGLSLKQKNLEAFKAALKITIDKMMTKTLAIPEIKYDAVINIGQINNSFYNIIKQMGPFGPGNEEPIFVCEESSDAGNSRIVKSDHLKLNIRQTGEDKTMDGIAFNLANAYHKMGKNNTFDLCFTINENIWNNKKQIELMVKDIHFNT